jgi:hypothetical protein
MMSYTRNRLVGLASGLFAIEAGAAGAQAAPSSPPVVAHAGAAQHDGQHDFDYLLGSWKIHLKKLVRPLTGGAAEWVEFDGTTVCRKVWDGRAELEEFSVSNREKNLHIEGLALRLYNPDSHQWSIYWATPKSGAIGGPPVVGEFRGGRGEFYDQEPFNGRQIYTRYVWTNTTTKAPHFEQQYSDDGGKTWETNWITEQTKVSP